MCENGSGEEDESKQKQEGGDPLPIMDQVVAPDREQQRRHGDDQDRDVQIESRPQRVQALCGRNRAGCKETDVQEDAESDRQQCAVETKLAPALNQLRDAQTWTLR